MIFEDDLDEEDVIDGPLEELLSPERDNSSWGPFFAGPDLDFEPSS